MSEKKTAEDLAEEIWTVFYSQFGNKVMQDRQYYIKAITALIEERDKRLQSGKLALDKSLSDMQKSNELLCKNIDDLRSELAECGKKLAEADRLLRQTYRYLPVGKETELTLRSNIADHFKDMIDKEKGDSDGDTSIK